MFRCCYCCGLSAVVRLPTLVVLRDGPALPSVVHSPFLFRKQTRKREAMKLYNNGTLVQNNRNTYMRAHADTRPSRQRRLASLYRRTEAATRRSRRQHLHISQQGRGGAALSPQNGARVPGTFSGVCCACRARHSHQSPRRWAWLSLGSARADSKIVGARRRGTWPKRRRLPGGRACLPVLWT